MKCKIGNEEKLEMISPILAAPRRKIKLSNIKFKIRFAVVFYYFNPIAIILIKEEIKL